MSGIVCGGRTGEGCGTPLELIDQPCPNCLPNFNRDTGGTSQRRGVHGDPRRRAGTYDVRNGDHFRAADTPLGDLIAGRIDQATYRRRMADLERHAADSLDVEPPPRRRPPEPDRSGMLIVYLAVIFGLVLLAIAIAGIVAFAAASALVAGPHGSPTWCIRGDRCARHVGPGPGGHVRSDDERGSRTA